MTGHQKDNFFVLTLMHRGPRGSRGGPFWAKKGQNPARKPENNPPSNQTATYRETEVIQSYLRTWGTYDPIESGPSDLKKWDPKWRGSTRLHPHQTLTQHLKLSSTISLLWHQASLCLHHHIPSPPHVLRLRTRPTNTPGETGRSGSHLAINKGEVF